MTLADKYKKATEIVNAAGGTPFPVTTTLIEIIKSLVEKDQLDFILAFESSKSQTLEQLRKSSGLPDDEIELKAKALAKKGFIFNQPSSKGVMVYRILPLINVGVFEYTFMQKLEFSEENKKLAALFTKLFREIDGVVQKSYDGVIDFMKHMPAVDRTVPFQVNKATGKPTTISINKRLERPVEYALPTDNVKEMIEKFDEIAVGHCFCRHHKDIEGHACKQTDMRENCFTFGKSARFTTEQGFMRMIDKKEALEILLKSEEDGLVHKAYHPNFDTTRDETSVCNCCKCCCGNSVDSQIGPIVNEAGYLADVDPATCSGCGTCEQYCHAEAIAVDDDGISKVDETRCIGCGVCAYFCPENAISLKESKRVVRIAPPRK